MRTDRRVPFGAKVVLGLVFDCTEILRGANQKEVLHRAVIKTILYTEMPSALIDMQYSYIRSRD